MRFLYIIYKVNMERIWHSNKNLELSGLNSDEDLKEFTAADLDESEIQDDFSTSEEEVGGDVTDGFYPCNFPGNIFFYYILNECFINALSICKFS